MAEVNVEGNSYYIPKELWKQIMDQKWWLEQESFWEKNWAVGRPAVDPHNNFDLPEFSNGCVCCRFVCYMEVLDGPQRDDSVVALRHVQRCEPPMNIRHRQMFRQSANGGWAVYKGGKRVDSFSAGRLAECTPAAIAPSAQLAGRYMHEKYDDPSGASLPPSELVRAANSDSAAVRSQILYKGHER
jgi:hypothetical protein